MTAWKSTSDTLQRLRERQGRIFGLVLLALMTVVMALRLEGPLPAMRLALFDAWQVLMPRERLSGPVQIVAIDEAALKEFGQWPWPRTRLAGLLERIAAHQPLAVGLDIIMPEHDTSSPEAIAAALGPEQAALRDALKRLPSHDAVLGAAMRRVPIVLGTAGFDVPAAGTTGALRLWPVHVRGGDALAHVRRFPQALASLPALQAEAKGQALLSADLEKGVIRRVPLVGAIGDTLVPAMSMELLRVATDTSAVELVLDHNGVNNVAVGDLHVPVQTDGAVWVHFSRPAPGRYLSAFDLMRGNADATALQDKVVLVALTGLGLMDYKTNARGDFLPGVDVHAQLIESFFDGRFLQRPVWMQAAEMAVLIACGLLLIWLVPWLGPRFAPLPALAMMLALFGGSALLFSKAGMLFDAATLFCAVAVLFFSLFGSMLLAEARERLESERTLHAVRESAARVAGELDAARRIQMATLPAAATAFPGETRFALDALLEPAREVSGDLYDFFMLDGRRLFFLVGDVSGKGLPASLFMVVAKALSKSIALRAEDDVAAILSRANRELARENPEMLFVTGIAGVLDVDTGELALCNAGHDAPRRLLPDGSIEHLPGADGPPLCVIEDFDYPVQRYQMQPGECLCLTTDGITEAMNADGVLYGSERLDELLRAVSKRGTVTPAVVVQAVRENVRAHVGDADASDDLTLMVLQWKP
ncbi:SpoIIE family protein phosphatase [Noviherbaspirillum denitrificans]|uniref:Chase2 sensor protein n=1 Tax=Noviherbaspirillum denitrificans TaxID=1968433 RepID=A0A254TCY9_9BURK|nr:CHASE2 domain-containing protein [Noviherbaspirillum denitrificans]OWW19182.1 chase2 sensor protein [Noviherbaspirillum denitrificans]